MDNQCLSYIEDTQNRKLYYRFTPAAFVSNFVPLVVVLDDEGKNHTTHFEYKMWNILRPIKSFECTNKELLQKLLRQIAQEYECEDQIYLYGSSLGGYEAILHGILCKANAVYAHTPRIRLQTTDSKESDLTNFLNSTDTFPIFYLSDSESNPDDDTAYFADSCKKHPIKINLNFCPNSRDDEDRVFKKVLDMFEKE